MLDDNFAKKQHNNDCSLNKYLEWKIPCFKKKI